MTRRKRDLLMLTALLVLAAPWTLGAEKKVEMSDVPAKVREAIKAKWPKAKIERAATDEVGGKTVYGFELSERAGGAARKWVARFNPDGKLRGTQEEVKSADLPKSVLQALQKRYPNVKEPTIEKITESEGKQATVTYEFKFAMQVSIDASGKIVEEKELDFDLEDAEE